MPSQASVKVPGKRAKARVEAAEVKASEKVNTEKLKDDIDAILDGIEDILVANAEAMVSSYIQSGGE